MQTNVIMYASLSIDRNAIERQRSDSGVPRGDVNDSLRLKLVSIHMKCVQTKQYALHVYVAKWQINRMPINTYSHTHAAALRRKGNETRKRNERKKEMYFGGQMAASMRTMSIVFLLPLNGKGLLRRAQSSMNGKWCM